jgi:alpha-2-macroglobulin
MTAQKSLKVPLVERTLTITATPNKSQYEPEEAASFDVICSRFRGQTGPDRPELRRRR